MTSNSADAVTPQKGGVPIWVTASVILTALLSLYSISFRYKAESLNKRVGIAVDWDTVTALAASARKTPKAALEDLKADGLTALVIGEVTVGEALLNESTTHATPVAVNLPGFDRAFNLRFGPQAKPRNPGPNAPFGIEFIDSGSIGETEVAPGVIRGMSLGLEPAAVKAASMANLDVVARLGNPLGATKEYVHGMVQWIKENGAAYFLPQGDQVLGRREATPTLLEALAANKIHYCTPEFAKIGGDASIVEKAPENVIRLHAAQAAELDKLTVSGAVERYAKAVGERNQRLLLVRPVDATGEKPLESFGDLIKAVQKEIEREGYTLGAPHPFEDSAVPSWLRFAIVFAIFPAVFWLIAVHLFPSTKGQLAAGLVILGVLALHAKGMGPQAAALLAATTFPLLAFVCLDFWSRKKTAWFPLFIGVTAVSLVGGLAVAGLLNGLPFFVKADVFMGVKLAHFLPIALIGAYFFWRLTPSAESLKSPILWSQAGIAMLLLVGFAFMASRTGNDNPAGVSGVELAFRSLLEKILVVRPRTKEFLIGHPFMIVAIAMLVRHRVSGMNKGGWIALLLMVGAVGQTSMVNTMCHLHTPLTVSLTRIGVGLVLGGIIGAASWALLSRFPKKAGS